MTMPVSNGPRTLADAVKVLRVVLMALVLGQLNFLAVVLILRWAAVFAVPANGTLVTTICFGVALSVIVASLLTPSVWDRALVAKMKALQPRSMAEEPIAQAYLARNITTLALMEAPFVMMLVAYMLEAQMVALVTAVGFAILLLTQWPSLTKATQWWESLIERARETSF